jgi:aminopeptidase
MTTNPSAFDTKLDRLAEIAVRHGVNLQPGQELLINAPVAAVPLVRAVARHAYRAGAIAVLPQFADQELSRIHLETGEEASFDHAPLWRFEAVEKAIAGGAAILSIAGNNPNLLAGCDSAKIARTQKAFASAGRGLAALIGGFKVNWSIIPFADAAWAQAVFPDLAADAAVTRLWDAIFAATRTDVPDPEANWRDHAAALAARTAYLNEKRFAALHFTGPGTDLHVGLIAGHRWVGGAADSATGIRCLPNIPTEEVFTMPHRDRVSGTVRATKPLSYAGTLIEDIAVRFENGIIVQAEARTGAEVFRNLIATDAGAARLGEVALVPDASPISQSGLLFQNTLFDENAASHIAIGRALAVNAPNFRPDQVDGANDSLIHVDWMIGSAAIDVDGLHADGTRHPVMRAGAFV